MTRLHKPGHIPAIATAATSARRKAAGIVGIANGEPYQPAINLTSPLTIGQHQALVRQDVDKPWHSARGAPQQAQSAAGEQRRTAIAGDLQSVLQIGTSLVKTEWSQAIGEANALAQLTQIGFGQPHIQFG